MNPWNQFTIICYLIEPETGSYDFMKFGIFGKTSLLYIFVNCFDYANDHVNIVSAQEWKKKIPLKQIM
jgi:hypothetical protein